MADEQSSFPLKSSSLSSELPQEPILETLLKMIGQVPGKINEGLNAFSRATPAYPRRDDPSYPDAYTQAAQQAPGTIPIDVGKMFADKLQQMAESKTTTVREELKLTPYTVPTGDPILPTEQPPTDEQIPDIPQERIIKTFRKGERLVALFGNLTSKRDKQGNLVIVQPPQTKDQGFPTIDSGKITDPDVVARSAVSSKGADFLTQRMIDINKADGANKIELILGTIGELDERIAMRNAKLREIADAQSGINEANAAVQMNRQQEIATGFAAKRPGAISKERIDAMAAASNASIVSDRFHQNLTESDPEINRLKAYRDNLIRTTSMSERIDALKEKREAERAFITPQMIMAYKYAFDEELKSDDEVRNAVKARAGDKKFMQIMNITEENAMANLVDADPQIRAAAFKIIAKAEKANNGKTELNSEYIRQLRAVAQDPNYFVSQKDIASMPSIKEKQTAVGISSGKDRDNAAFALRYAATQEGLSRGFLLNRYDIVDNWQLTDPEMTNIRATLQTQSPNGQVHVDQFFDNYLPSNLSKDEFTARVQKLAQSLQVTFQNAPRSFLFANQDDYRPAILAKLENKVNQRKSSWIMSKLLSMTPAGGIYQNIAQPTAEFIQKQFGTK